MNLLVHFTLCWFLLFAIPFFGAVAVAAERRPNVIVILADDLGYGESDESSQPESQPVDAEGV